MDCVKEGVRGVFLEVHVVPNSKKESIEYDEFSKRLRIKISEPAVDGKANKQLIEQLTEMLGGCKLLSGQTSRKKTIFIFNKTKDEVIEDIKKVLKK